MTVLKKAGEMLSRIDRFSAGIVMLILGAAAGWLNFHYAGEQLKSEEDGRTAIHQDLVQQQQSFVIICYELFGLSASEAKRDLRLQNALAQQKEKLKKPGGN